MGAGHEGSDCSWDPSSELEERGGSAVPPAAPQGQGGQEGATAIGPQARAARDRCNNAP